MTSTINGNLRGNSSIVTKLQTARTIQLSGAVSGSVSFDGSGNILTGSRFSLYGRG